MMQTLKVPQMMRAAILTALLVFMCGGCAATRPQLPSTAELAAIDGHRKSLVVFRVTTTIEGKPIDLLTNDAKSPAVGFESAQLWQLQDAAVDQSIHSLDDASWHDGWCYIMLEPG